MVEPIYAKAYYKTLILSAVPPSYQFHSLDDNLTSIINIQKGIKSNSEQLLNSFNIGDCPIFESFTNSNTTEGFGPPIVYRYDFTIRLHGIRLIDYLYYKNLISQLNPQNTLFDPIPIQIKGNMICLTDPSINVYGYFNVFNEISLNAQFNNINAPTSYTLNVDTLKN